LGEAAGLPGGAAAAEGDAAGLPGGAAAAEGEVAGLPGGAAAAEGNAADPLDDTVARAAAVAARGSVLVQAPAGSGKTTLLTQRYLRLLAEVELPEQILALTFTRRAAEEMRQRVVQALEAATAGRCPDGMSAATFALARAAHGHCSSVGIDLAGHAARLRIETIDAFNAWIARQLPVGSGTGAGLALQSDPTALYAEAARRTLAHDDVDSFGAAVERVLSLADQRWSRVSVLIATMLAKRERWLPLLAGGFASTDGDQADAALRALRECCNEDLRLLVARSLHAASAALGAERLDSLAHLVDGAARRLGGLAGWHLAAGPRPISCAVEDLERWRGLLSILLTQRGSLRTRVNKHHGFPPGCPDKQAMQALLTELARDATIGARLAAVARLPDPAYLDSDWTHVSAVARCLLLAVAHLEQIFREQGMADFPAVALAARRALGSPLEPTDLALRLDYRLRHILIDEFQDTSGSQLALLRMLTAGWQRGDGRTVFCVGDPMQSIYRFRQAEVRAFLELADDGIGDLRFEVQRLTSNFRSAEAIVDWVNASFARLLPRADDRERGAIAYRPSRALRGSATGADAGVSMAGYATRRGEALANAEVIAAARRTHPEWRIAVLVRAKAHAIDLAAALGERRIDFSAIDIEPLGNRPIVRDLVMLARALYHPADRIAWLAVLRAPWAGVELGDLWVLARAAPLLCEALAEPAVLARLTPAGRSRCERVREIFDAARDAQAGQDPVRWIESVWLALGGPACATDPNDLAHAAAAFERLRELERRGLPDPADFDAAFDALFARDTVASAVEIMTIHKAKGLEFDLVILPALERTITQGGDEFLLSLELARPEREAFIMAARPAVGARAARLFEFLRAQARDAAGLEAQRLLYVACTRAKWQLRLTATVGQCPAGREFQPRAASLLGVLWPVVGAQWSMPRASEPAAPPQPPEPAVPPPPLLRGAPLRRVPTDWAPAPLVAPPLRAEPPLAVDRRTPAVIFDWAGETARQVGSLVHAELQQLRLEADAAADVRRRVPQFERWLALRGVPAERCAEAARRVQAALVGVLEDPRGRWILDAGHREQSRELALSGSTEQGVIRVVFDRSFIDADGVRWVIDYKTSEHRGGGMAQFLDREVERYAAQLQRYADLAQALGPEPVRLALYFPLIRAWREWLPRPRGA
jgi:ATP-dependent exoDNAse (exonuclease V) beta subunit